MPNRVISFHFILTNDSGDTLASSKDSNPLTYMEGVGQVLPGLEDGIRDLKVGDKKKISLPSKDAFGKRDEKRVVRIPIDQLPKKDVQVGDRFHADDDDMPAPMTVVEIDDSHAILDGNHPLAGMDLTFDIEVTEIREPTAEEIEHGHAHGPGGHHHH